jgi:neutral amino acid transport system ATP-binding protein
MSETPAGPSAPPPPLLDVRRLHRSFGGVHAVNECSIAVAPHTITGLIGPNGSGKTTAFNIITGYLAATSGEVRFAGRRHPRPDPRRMYLAGLTRTFQQARVFPELTVLENLVVAARRDARALFGRRVTDRDREQAMAMLSEFNLDGHAGKKASALSYGQRKLLDFAAALISDPRLVMLDEPTAGVNPVMIGTMERHIRDRHDRGVTFLIVEHDMNFVMRVCDPIIVLNQGAPIVVGPPAQVQTDPRVLEAYLGD